MKRTAAAFVLLAGLGGGCMTTDKKSEPVPSDRMGLMPSAPGYVGPHGAPVQPASYARGQAPGIVRADARNVGKGGIVPVSNPGYYDEVGLTAKGVYPVAMGNDGTRAGTRAAASCPSRPWARTGPWPPSGPCPRTAWAPRSMPAPPSGSATRPTCGSPGTVRPA